MVAASKNIGIISECIQAGCVARPPWHQIFVARVAWCKILIAKQDYWKKGENNI